MDISGQIRAQLRLYGILATLSASGLLVSCGSPGKNLQLAKDSVGLFHAQLDAEQYRSIYSTTDERFHQVTTEADFTKLLQAIHSKLGTVQQSNLRNQGMAWYAGQGTTVTLLYDTKFAEGTGTEQFVWHINSGHASLYSYHINSNDLITR
jgi:Protein of unknown function (DUF4019)